MNQEPTDSSEFLEIIHKGEVSPWELLVAMVLLIGVVTGFVGCIHQVKNDSISPSNTECTGSEKSAESI